MAAHASCCRLALVRLPRRVFVRHTSGIETARVENEVSNFNGGGTIYCNDFPELFLAHSVKRAYKVHATLRTLRPLEKASWLSKTIFNLNLPGNEKHKGESLRPSFCEAFKEHVYQSAGSQKASPNVSDGRLHAKDITFGHLFDSLQLVVSEGRHLPHLQGCFIDNVPNVQTYWFRNYLFFHTAPDNRPDYVLRTRHPLSPVESIADAIIDDPSSLPGPYNTSSLNAFLSPIVKLRNDPGYHSPAANPVPCPHTLLVSNGRAVTPHEMQSQAIMSSFFQAHAYALSTGRLPGTVLERPVVVNCVVTNGNQAVFCVYQLNTLSMLDDVGVWNRAWVTAPVSLFTPQADPRHGYRQSAGPLGLTDHDPACLQHMAMLIHRETSSVG